MKTADTHPLAEQYLDELRSAARVLPRWQRNELVAEIGAHLAEGVRAASTEAEVRNLIDDLGLPHEVVDAARPAVSGGRGNIGMLALVLGVVALLAAFVPLVGMIVAIPAGLTAILLGRRARREAASMGGTDAAATAGLALGIAALVVPVLLTLILVAARTTVEGSDPVVEVEAPITTA